MTNEQEWLEFLSDDDRAFLKRFVLASGSLKETARHYGISYPTVRIRLDRLIAKIEAIEQSRDQTVFERLLRGQFAEGRIDEETFQALLAAYRTEQGE